MSVWKNESHIRLQNISKSFQDLSVLKNINLNIFQGEFLAIVGKSGCGKSTLLRLIAGLETLNEGSIEINGTTLKGLNQNARIMFQDGRLLPWKRVIDNVGTGLTGNWKRKAQEALKNVGLESREQDWPYTLSGGQKQRVALARALVHEPNILLLDEPLGALDALTRIEMQELIEALWKRKKITTILVTHDVEEAVAMADRVILLKDGSIELNQSIPLKRPRQRSSQEFTAYVEEILNLIMDRTDHDIKLVSKKKSISL